MKRDVMLRVEGAMLDRLLQRALDAGAEFGRVQRLSARAMRFETNERGAEILTELCRKYHLNLRVLHRGGAPALWRRLRARWTLLPGLLLGALICALLLSRVWIIDVDLGSGDAALEAQLRARIAELGVKPGMPRWAVDTSLLEKQLAATAQECGFVGVRLQGVCLRVEAMQALPIPETYRAAQARDLVAARDGVVEKVFVRAGTACVKIGDTVRAGQLLIRGEERSGADETRAVSALGEVYARCWFEGSASGSTVRARTVPTGRTRTSCRLRLKDLEIPLSSCAPFAQQRTAEEILPVVGLYLPLEVVRTTQQETKTIVEHVDADALSAQLTALAQAEAQVALSGMRREHELRAAWTDAETTSDTLRIRAVYEISADIAVARSDYAQGG